MELGHANHRSTVSSTPRHVAGSLNLRWNPDFNAASRGLLPPPKNLLRRQDALAQAVDLFAGVVQVKTGAGAGGGAETLVERMRWPTCR